MQIELRAVPQGTEISITHTGLFNEETRLSHEQGWNGALDKLVRHLQILEQESAS